MRRVVSHFTITLLGVALSAAVACSNEQGRADESKLLPAELTGWALALSSSEWKNEELTQSGGEFSVTLAFGKPTLNQSGDRVTLPVTLGYEGAVRRDVVTARALGRDSVDRAVVVEGGEELPLPKTKREMKLSIPVQDQLVLVVAAGAPLIALEYDGTRWKLVETEGAKRLVDARAFLKCCDELKTAADTNKAYNGALVACLFSAKDVVTGERDVEVVRKTVLAMISSPAVPPAACSPVKSER